MALFAPGVAQGLLDSQAIDRQKAKDQLDADAKRQAMAWQNAQMEDTRQQRANQLRTEELTGQVLNRQYGPPPPGMQPQGQPMAPPPGQNSAPPQPPGPPQGGIPPQPPQGVQGMGGPQPQPMPGGPPPMMPPGAGAPRPQPPGPPPPYRTREAAMQPPAPPPQPAPSGPPPVGGQPQGQGTGGGPLNLQSIVKNATEVGADPKEVARVVANMQPLMREQLTEQLNAAKQNMEQANIYMKEMRLELDRQKASDLNAAKAASLDERKNRDQTLKDQGNRRLGISAANAGFGGSGAGAGASGGRQLTEAQQDTLDMKAWKYIETNQLPNRKGKGGPNDPNEIVMQRAAAIGRELGKSPQELAAMPASFKSNALALSHTTSDLAAIRPYKEMLDKNADILSGLADKIVTTDSKLANKTLNWIKSNAGDNPDTADYLAQMHFVQAEAARVLNNPRLVGQMTDSARNEMQQVVSGDMPINSTKRVIQRLKTDGDNRINAMTKERDALQGDLSGKSRSAPATGGWSDKDEARLKELEAKHGSQ